MHLSKLDDLEPFTTLDGSTIREIAGPAWTPARNQSLAEATVPVVLVIQTASADAAVQDAPSTGMRAMTLFVRGSMRATGPSGPAKSSPSY